jgi:hypothetical protein
MAFEGAVKWRGGLVCECVIVAATIAEQRMLSEGLVKKDVDIFQYGYNAGGVKASAGTHDGGGVLDVNQYSWPELIIWRESGFWMWRRTPAQGFSYHGHGVVKGCPHVSDGARYQISEGEHGRNGLANRRLDDGPDVHVPTWKQAAAKYKQFIDVSVPPAPKEDDLDMAKTLYKRSTEPQALKPDTWQFLQVENNGTYTVSGVNPLVDVTATVTVTGLGKGRVAQFSWQIIEWKKGAKSIVVNTRDLVELQGSDGIAATQVRYVGSVPKPKHAGYSTRLRLIAKTFDPGVKVTKVQIQGWTKD